MNPSFQQHNVQAVGAFIMAILNHVNWIHWFILNISFTSEPYIALLHDNLHPFIDTM